MKAKLLLCCAFLLAMPGVARADLVRLKNGRTLSVESWEIKGETVVLVFREGGQLETPASSIDEVLPDEYPRLKPAPPAALVVEAPPAPVDDIPALVTMMAERYGVDPKLAHAVVRVESNYRPSALSPKGAAGLMQLMPATAKQYDVDAYNPAENLEAGMRHLKGLLERFRNDVRLALAAYNAGVFAVTKYGGVPPYRETQDYVRRIMALAR
jgi:soluble lytic murein transglycosylase-like protein